MPRRRIDIVPGQRFVSRGTYPQVWEVIGLHKAPGEPHLHVKLARFGCRYDFKTISVSALLDRRFFDLVHTPPQEAEPPLVFAHKTARRKAKSIGRSVSRLRLGIARAAVDG